MPILKTPKVVPTSLLNCSREERVGNGLARLKNPVGPPEPGGTEIGYFYIGRFDTGPAQGDNISPPCR